MFLVKVFLQCQGLQRLIRYGTWCIDIYLWQSYHLVTKEGVNGMDPKLVYCGYDSLRPVHLHRVDKVRWSCRVCKRHQNDENFYSKCYHFTATKTSVTVSVKQHEHDRVTRCTFSVDLKKIKTIPQTFPSTCAICLQPQQSGRCRGEIENLGYLEPWFFEYEFWDFFQRYCIPDRHLRNDALKCPKVSQDGMVNMSSWYKLRSRFTAVRL